MSFLDKTGLARLWANIVTLVENKTDEAKRYADENDSDTVYDDTTLSNRVAVVETKTTNVNYADGQTTINNARIMNGEGETSLDLQDLRLDIKYQSADASRARISMNRRFGAWVNGSYVSFPIGYGSTSLGTANVAQGRESVALGEFTWTRGDQQVVTGHHNKIYDATSYFIVGNGAYGIGPSGIVYGEDNPLRSNAFRVTSDGNCHAGASFLNGNANADFAEYFEWADGNPDNEDRRGRIVTLEDDKIKLASLTDACIGVISATGAFVGNSASEDWNKKYLTDIFGEVITEEVDIPELRDPETGSIIVEAHTEIQRKINPDFDVNLEYIPRSERKEWAVVGLVGQVIVVDDGTCQVGGYVKPSTNGIGTAADAGYRVMKRIDETHIKVLVK